ncbi:Signal peptidase I [[Clostridium] ultunense Esp]|uniref:Signal peptidase I n=1 Tax=[Clostridium] ultunense Esp TaxID=1288971 RepID=M1YQF9_9FIRM|nr:signal peptidase I [Schnuerera ultunensis]CCQ92770.1 Signal peptidase I [[Clostridium] ultunense Esp]SHD75782.1 Signal peptidase I [[Clostridium] ultunense Esp]
MKKEIIEWIKSIGIALILGFIITSFIGGTKVHGSSMNPTLNQGDILVMFNSKKISNGDIVIINTDLEITPQDLEGLNPISKWKVGNTKKLVKRVIATEGDNLVIEKGKVFLNGYELKEDYIKGNETFGDLRIEKIPEDKIFVMGDNRGNSFDSRSKELGLVDVDDVRGKAIIRIYPFLKFGIAK